MKIKDAIAQKTPVFVLAYKPGSASAKAIGKHLSGHGKVSVRARDPVHVPGIGIGWGVYSVQAPHLSVFNQAQACAMASDKRRALSTLSNAGVACPTHSTSADDATEWLTSGDKVVARHVVHSHSGRGIQIVSESGTVYRDPSMPDDAPWYEARLFTKYFKKTTEYRVFAVQGKAVLVYRKGVQRDIPEDERQFLVRTHATGWNFCSVELSDVPERVLIEAVAAQEAMRLDFCAVDIGWHEPSQSVCVFEVNTAPGVEGSSVQILGDALLEMDTDHTPVRAADTAPTPVSDEIRSAFSEGLMSISDRMRLRIVVPAPTPIRW